VELGAKSSVVAACAGVLMGCSSGTEGWVLTENTAVGGGGSAGQPPIDASDDRVFEAGVGPPGTGSRNPEGFAGACTPELSLQNRASDQDFRLFRDAFPDFSDVVLTTAKRVCALLYKRPDEVPRTDRLTIVLQDFQGAGSIQDYGNQTTVYLSTAYMRNTQSYGGSVRAEVGAILYYLEAIDYELHPENPDELRWLIEGVGEWVRHEAGQGMSGRRRRGGSWTDGGSTTGYFINWIDNEYPDAAYLLNQSMNPYDNARWSEQVFVDITGQTVQALWNRYQASL
jgi:basic secretory peptidase family protein